MTPEAVPFTNNLLLRSLPPESLARLEPHFLRQELQIGETVFESETANDAFFPLDGVISLLREFEDGSTLEVGMVGGEGIAGVNVALGAPINPLLGLIQGRGVAARIKGSVLREAVRNDEALRDLLLRYVNTFLVLTSQIAACNRLHVVEERLAHWLLLLHDRTGSDVMSLTQEFLARMLGTRRAGINVAMRALKEAGCIEHARNRVRVIDRARLEEMSCSCYEFQYQEYERSLGFPPRTPRRQSPID